MERQESEFPQGWVASTSEPLWEIAATYGRVPPEALPTLPPKRFDGSFDWLLECAPLGRGLDFKPDEPDSADLDAYPAIRAEARALGLRVPEAFERFVSDPDIHRRVLTPTGCYLGFSPNLVEDPSGRGGRMLRFLNDSQGSMFWYLYLSTDGTSVVLASHEWRYAFGVPDEPPNLQDYLSTGPNFETFVCRFWIESLIFEHCFRRKPLSPELAAYVSTARANRGLGE